MSHAAGTIASLLPPGAVAAAHRFLYFESQVAPVRSTRVRHGPVGVPVRRELADFSPEVRAFYARLFASAGLDARHYRDRALTRRLAACLRALRVRSVAEASVAIAAQPDLARIALNTVLLGVTGFFRDPVVFEYLEKTLLPGLVTLDCRPRVWSVACSDGQELYSVAMLLERAGRLAGCELLGTDCRADAIRRARAGDFPPDGPGASGLPWSEPSVRGRRQMPAALSAAITWKQADVLAGAEPGPWHLILCRNLAIYLEPASADSLWSTLAAALVPGGYLVVGKADYPSRQLPLQRIAGGVYRKVSLS